MIMWFGVIGAAWATMLAGLISVTMSIIVAQFYYKINYEWAKVAWIMGTFFVGSMIITSMNLTQSPYIWSLSVKITVIVIYITLGLKYEIITSGNYDAVKSALLARNI